MEKYLRNKEELIEIQKFFELFTVISAAIIVLLEIANWVANTPSDDSCNPKFAQDLVEYWNSDGPKCAPIEIQAIYNHVARFLALFNIISQVLVKLVEAEIQQSDN
jgi:hypothetical protein